jgi:hypothetical protein
VFHAADIKFEIKWNYKLLFDIFDELLVEWLTIDEPEKSVTQVCCKFELWFDDFVLVTKN